MKRQLKTDWIQKSNSPFAKATDRKVLSMESRARGSVMLVSSTEKIQVMIFTINLEYLKITS